MHHGGDVTKALADLAEQIENTTISNSNARFACLKLARSEIGSVYIFF